MLVPLAMQTVGAAFGGLTARTSTNPLKENDRVSCGFSAHIQHSQLGGSMVRVLSAPTNHSNAAEIFRRPRQKPRIGRRSGGRLCLRVLTDFPLGGVVGQFVSAPKITFPGKRRRLAQTGSKLSAGAGLFALVRDAVTHRRLVR
jgi:hypothetical protein